MKKPIRNTVRVNCKDLSNSNFVFNTTRPMTHADARKRIAALIRNMGGKARATDISIFNIYSINRFSGALAAPAPTTPATAAE